MCAETHKQLGRFLCGLSGRHPDAQYVVLREDSNSLVYVCWIDDGLFFLSVGRKNSYGIPLLWSKMDEKFVVVKQSSVTYSFDEFYRIFVEEFL